MRRSLLYLLCFLSVARIYAHGDYETAQGIYSTAGNTYSVAFHFVDGIFFNDPVKVIVRTSDGNIAAETSFTHDAALLTRNGQLMVFQYDGFLSVFAQAVWSFDGLALRPIESSELFIISPLIRIKQHAVGYSIATLFLLGIARSFRGLLGRKDWRAGCTIILTVIVVVPLYLYVVILLTQISFPIVSSLLALIVVVWRASKALFAKGRTSATPR